MKKLTEEDLAQFNCTENHYRHFTGLKYTDGVKFMAEVGEAYWLIDAIASYQAGLKDPILKAFQLWELVVTNGSAVLTARPDSDQEPVITQEIPYTDFPFDIKLWVSSGVLLLPSEY